MERILESLIEDKVLAPNDIKARTLSVQLNKSPGYVWDVQHGRSKISPSFAIELEKLSGIPAIRWMYHQALDEMNEYLTSQGEKTIPYDETIIFSSNNLSIDNILALREGTIKTSHAVHGNRTTVFDDNPERTLQLYNDHAPCWIEKTFKTSPLVVFGMIVLRFDVGTRKTYRPKRVKLEWVTSKSFSQVEIDSVKGDGKLEDNAVYIEVTGSKNIEITPKVSKKCKGVRVTMIGATSACLITEVSGYELLD